MDLRKIGKFIAKKRQENNYTQESLAEALDVSNRSISKWERGICLPESSRMAELCKLLNITINDLFNGEKVNMKTANQNNEKLLIDMAKRQEIINKRTYARLLIAAACIMAFYLLIVVLVAYFYPKDVPAVPLAIIIGATVAMTLSFLYIFKIEADLGYYMCEHCKHEFAPTYGQTLRAMHMGTTRYLKCPKCHKRAWMKKHF